MHHELDRLAFRDAPHRLDVLSKLPDVISSAADDPDLFARLCDMLLAGIRRADAVALVTPEKVLHWDRRFAGEGEFVPSHRLIVEAVEKQKQTVLHVWSSRTSQTRNEQFTMAAVSTGRSARRSSARLSRLGALRRGTVRRDRRRRRCSRRGNRTNCATT